MLILAIDTSGTTASAALVSDEPQGYTALAESHVKLSRPPTASETLIPMVEKIFKTTNIFLENVDYIACTSGPGSFTGLRIGAAAAKGLAFAADKPLIPVPALDAMAYVMDGLVTKDTWIAPMMDARRGQVYTAFYHDGVPVTDYMAGDVVDLAEMLKDLVLKEPPESHKKNIVFLGAEIYRDRIEKVFKASIPTTPEIIFAAPRHGQIQAGCVGGLALSIAKEGIYIDESEFSLLYIRKPQAQREREESKAIRRKNQNVSGC